MPLSQEQIVMTKEEFGSLCESCDVFHMMKQQDDPHQNQVQLKSYSTSQPS